MRGRDPGKREAVYSARVNRGGGDMELGTERV